VRPSGGAGAERFAVGLHGGEATGAVDRLKRFDFGAGAVHEHRVFTV
jgi:hypothetical protein